MIYYFSVGTIQQLQLPHLSQRAAGVPSGFIEQMEDEMLLIPERSLSLMDTIGQGNNMMHCKTD